MSEILVEFDYEGNKQSQKFNEDLLKYFFELFHNILTDIQTTNVPISCMSLETFTCIFNVCYSILVKSYVYQIKKTKQLDIALKYLDCYLDDKYDDGIEFFPYFKRIDVPKYLISAQDFFRLHLYYLLQNTTTTCFTDLVWCYYYDFQEGMNFIENNLDLVNTEFINYGDVKHQRVIVRHKCSNTSLSEVVRNYEKSSTNIFPVDPIILKYIHKKYQFKITRGMLEQPPDIPYFTKKFINKHLNCHTC